MKKTLVLAVVFMLSFVQFIQAQTMIGVNDIKLSSDLMTPEALWAMGRIGSCAASPDGKHIVYQVGYYDVHQNKGHQILYVIDSNGENKICLTNTAKSETDPSWLNNNDIAFLCDGQVYTIHSNGTGRRQLTNDKTEIEGFKFSPDGKHIILIKSLPYYGSIRKRPDDLPLSTGRVITDMNYRHWDHYVESIPHPFIANVNDNGVDVGEDILKNEPYECPMAPFGGVEQISWSPNGQTVAYTCRKKEGVKYAVSTDADIYLYDISSKKTCNLCKPAEYIEPKIDATKSMRNQQINHQAGDYNVGYDVNPQFSPDGKYLAWQSMARNGYESDRNRLCIFNISTRNKKYVTESLDTNVDEFTWSNDSKELYFTACWHATVMLYQTNLNGEVKQLTNGWYDYSSPQMLGLTKNIIVKRHSMSHPDDIFIISLAKKEKMSVAKQITDENKKIFDQLAKISIQERWVNTTDGKKEQVWIILPPHFDANKKYPTLLYCEGGPQSPVSQFWSYRWNFYIMASHGYVIVAPNRRGLPGYGTAWNEEISGDWTGQCMDDYLSAIDDATKNLSFVDKDKLGCVGASFGGFSVYYLAGHHNKRFKCFIAHDGAFNLESMYTDTEEAWFSNWEYDDAYWNADKTLNANKTYSNSPHKAVDNWDTPILCIHGEKDYRINANQGFGAFNAARMKGIPAELLLFPDENHWVLKPQNGILWQRTFFEWLDRWLKK
jgi:dipeptidyl aminopeptidase/acylaminoacyl peptidase